MFKSMKNFAHDDSGATAIEYALIASLIACAIVAAATALGGKIAAVFGSITSTLTLAN